MAETAAARAIVHEVLNKDNYVEWKFPVVTYLKAQDLWDVIVEDQPIGLKQFLEAKGIARAKDFEDEEKANDEASKEVQSEAEIKAWLKKNATALHVIIISCGKDALRAISGTISAKKAWKTLEAKYNPPLLVTESSNSQDENLVYQPFFDAVGRDDWSSAQEFLNKHPEAKSVRDPVLGRTALHIAARRGYEQMVQTLIQVMREEDQEILDNDGATALVLALGTGKTSIAKFMADKNRKILGIPFRAELPVCSAFGYGNINLARYLYFITPEEYLCRHGARLLFTSMQDEQYDIALDLLEKCPSMTISKAMLEEDRIITLLENMLKAFPTASRRQQLIYDSLLKQFASNARKLLDLLSATLKTPLGIKHLHKKKLANACVTKVVERICEEIKNLDDGQLRANTYISKAIIHAITHGALEFVVRLTYADQRLSRLLDEETGGNMIANAIQYRQEKIVSFYMHMEKIVRENF